MTFAMKEEKKDLSSADQIIRKLDSIVRTISLIELSDYGNMDRKNIKEKLQESSEHVCEKLS